VKEFGRTPRRYPGSNAERFEHESLGTGPVSVAGYERDGCPRRGQVTLRRLVGWQDLNSLKSQAAAWQLDTQLLNSLHSDANYFSTT